jgi:hypothetical protein
MATLQDALDKAFAEAWRPQPGEKIVGEVIDLSERTGAYGRYPIVTVRTGDGEERALHAFHEVLANELGRVAPKVGDVIGVRYDGNDEDKGYHRYRVRRAGDGSGLDWSRYGGDQAESDLEPDLREVEHLPSGEKSSTGDDGIPF